MSDITKFKSYSNLKKHKIFLADTHLRNPSEFSRAQKYTQEEGNFSLDFSKTHLDDKVLSLFQKYAEDCEIAGKMQNLLSGEHVNVSENRPALHMAWRASEGTDYRLDGRSIMPEILETRAKMKEFSEAIAAGKIVGSTGERFLDIVHVGIGGSILPTKYLSKALHAHKRAGIGLHFVETVDGTELQEVKMKLRPETTLIVLISKTFRTREMLLNASYLKEWIDDALGTGAYRQHMIAATANVKNAHQFGILDEHIFPFKNWVGGRFSTTTPASITLPLYCNWSTFERVLKGAEKVDETIKKTAFADTMAYKLALLSVWYRLFWNTTTEGFFPYTKRLEGLKDLVQMLEYESNGKPKSYPTGVFMFGGVGSGVEHQFFQKLQQVPEKTLSTFLLIQKPIIEGQKELHEALTAHALGFSEGLAVGHPKTKDMSEAEVCEGNQPSVMLLIKELTPENIGGLIAQYEYKTIFESFLLDINAFDGFGVIPGKNIAQTILQGGTPALASTVELLKRLKS
ncbi:MAG: hypothetical protein ACTSXV_02290 [Alphaproteobacteria bacterium]